MLERVKLFDEKRDYFYFFLLAFTLLAVSLSIELYHYKNLKKNKTAIVKAQVLNEYIKTTPTKSYKVIKLRSNHGATFYTTASVRFHSVKNKEVLIKISTSKLTFLSYLKGFYAKGWFLKSYKPKTLKNRLDALLHTIHKNNDIYHIYAALYLAKPLTYELYNRFSALGISHLFAISGFHLGILSFVVYFFLFWLYKPLHAKFFPYRNIKRDIFIATALILFCYLDFLAYPPSLVRSYVMLVVGFYLYDRGIKVISMQTLFVAVVLILSISPRLFFSLGFWLSVSGVYYILLFLIHYKSLAIWKQFFMIPIWVYLSMLPISLYIFGNFSYIHPFSIVFTVLFSVFYPFSLLLHLSGFGAVLDHILQKIVFIPIEVYHISLPTWLILLYILLSFGASVNKKLLYTLAAMQLLLFLTTIFLCDK